MAEHLTHRFGKSVSAPWVRQTPHRARDKFADLLTRWVEETILQPTAEPEEQELIDLDLLPCCQPAVDRYSCRF